MGTGAPGRCDGVLLNFTGGAGNVKLLFRDVYSNEYYTNILGSRTPILKTVENKRIVPDDDNLRTTNNVVFLPLCLDLRYRGRQGPFG